MVRQSLPEDVIAATSAFLNQMDSLGMAPQGAMWVYHHLLEYWRFYLVTSLVETIGPAKILDLLFDTQAWSGLPEGFDPMEVRLRWPSDRLMQGLSALGETGPDGLARFQNIEFDGETYDGVILRRLGAAPSEKETRAIGRRFAKNVKALRQAAE